MLHLLEELGWSRAKLARQVGVNPHTVGKWVDAPPKLVVEYLTLVVTLKRLYEQSIR